MPLDLCQLGSIHEPELDKRLRKRLDGCFCGLTLSQQICDCKKRKLKIKEFDVWQSYMYSNVHFLKDEILDLYIMWSYSMFLHSNFVLFKYCIKIMPFSTGKACCTEFTANLSVGLAQITVEFSSHYQFPRLSIEYLTRRAMLRHECLICFGRNCKNIRVQLPWLHVNIPPGHLWLADRQSCYELAIWCCKSALKKTIGEIIGAQGKCTMLLKVFTHESE